MQMLLAALLAPDVLLARAQRHDERALAVEVGRHPDEPAGDLADERVGRGEDPEVRPAVLGRDPERLALAGGDVGAVRAGRREDGQRDGLDDRDEERAGGVGEPADLGHRLEQAEEVGLAGDHAGDGSVRVGQQPLEGGEVGRPGGRAVGDERDLVDGRGRRRRSTSRSSRGSGGWTARETRTRSRRVARQVMSAASAVAAAPS